METNFKDGYKNLPMQVDIDDKSQLPHETYWYQVSDQDFTL
jgi:hypothetical protein